MAQRHEEDTSDPDDSGTPPSVAPVRSTSVGDHARFAQLMSPLAAVQRSLGDSGWPVATVSPGATVPDFVT